MLVKAGSTDVITYFKLVDSALGTPETAYTVTDLDLTYIRDQAAAVKADALAHGAVTDAHTDLECIEIDATNAPGVYRIDWPDAAFVAGVKRVQLVVNGSGLDPAVMEVELIAVDAWDTVRAGLTALPNAAADAAGGLPISDAGGLDLDTKLANTNEITAARMGALTDWIDGGRLDLLLDACSTHNAAAVVTALLADATISADGTTTLSQILNIIFAFCGGNITRTGDAYAYKDTDASTLFTHTMTDATRTRS